METKTKWGELLFDVRRSVRYHNHRRQFFDTLGNITRFLTIISGGGVIAFSAAKTQEATPILICGAAASLLAAIDLVLGLSIRAREHFDLSKRFIRVEQTMVEIGDDPTEANFKENAKARLEIEADEPPVYRLLDVWCYNELLRASGHDEKEMYVLNFWQRNLRHFCNLGIQDIKKVGEIK